MLLHRTTCRWGRRLRYQRQGPERCAPGPQVFHYPDGRSAVTDSELASTANFFRRTLGDIRALPAWPEPPPCRRSRSRWPT